MEQLIGTDEPAHRPVVIGVDGGPAGEEAVRVGLEEAACWRTEAVLIRSWHHRFVGCDGASPVAAVAATALSEEAESTIAAVLAAPRVRGSGPVPRVCPLVCEGDARDVLVAASEQAAMVVVGSRGHTGAAGLLFGSVSLHCAARARCPVMVVPPTAVGPQGPDEDDPAGASCTGRPAIVVGVDGSACSRAALAWAVDEGRRRAWPVRAVTVWSQPTAVTPLRTITVPDRQAWAGAAARLEADLAAVAAGPDVDVRGRVVYGSPFTSLMAAAGPGNLLVLGSRGHGGFAGLLLGSVVQYALGHARCPVVVVHGRA